MLDDKIIAEINAYDDDKEKILRKMDLMIKILNIKSKAEAEDWICWLHANCFSYDDQDYDIDLIIQSLAKLQELSKKQNEESNKKDNYLNFDEKENSKSKHWTEARERDYWKNVNNVLDSETLELWTLLEQFSSRYYNVLKTRQTLIVENREIKKKNAELRQ